MPPGAPARMLNKISAAYVIATGNSSQKSATDILSKATEAISKALEAP